MTPRAVVIEMPPGLPLLNANDRIHYRVRAQKTELLRSEAFRLAQGSPALRGKVKIRCTYRAPDNRRRDVANLYPSFKACIDGAVSAGVLEDDSDRYVTELTLARGGNLTGKGQLVIEFTEAGDGDSS